MSIYYHHNISDLDITSLHIQINNLENKYNCSVLWLVECGSRAYGIHSKDSDYDIRGVFVYNDPKTILELTVPNNKIKRELSCFSDDKTLDISMWEVGYAIGMIRGCNANIHSWLSHTIDGGFIYVNRNQMFQQHKEIAVNGNITLSTLRHNLGLMTSMFKKQVDPYRDHPVKVLSRNNITKIKTSYTSLLSAMDSEKPYIDKINSLVTTLNNIKISSVDSSESSIVSLTNVKKCLYVLRPLLTIFYILYVDTSPPLDVNKMLDALKGHIDNISDIKTLLYAKMTLPKDKTEIECPGWLIILFTECSIKAKDHIKNMNKKNNIIVKM